MRVLILTTDTPHHRRFVQQIATLKGVAVETIIETSQVAIPYETAHPFEGERDHHERTIWLDPPNFDQFGPLTATQNANECDFPKHDLCIVFGTGILRPATIAALNRPLLNLHGGDTALYRGLDSHLWAIWHRDTAGLVTTLHHVHADLDAGPVFRKRKLDFSQAPELHHLRAVNTEACISMVSEAIMLMQSSYPRYGSSLEERLQLDTRRSRYYGAMPTALKDVCVRRYRRIASWTTPSV